jgi:hypothetical protein
MEREKMHLGRKVLALAIMALCLAVTGPAAFGSSPDAGEGGVLQADQAWVSALNRADAEAIPAMLDQDFSWTDAAGETRGRQEILDSLPQSPLGDEGEARLQVKAYGQLAAVQVSRDRHYLLRIWAQRDGHWRLLVLHEVRQLDAPAGGSPHSGPNDCENPCKGVPYTPRNEAERSILASWSELETAVTNHDPATWSAHFLDEFVLLSSGRPEPVNKAGRIAQLSQPGTGPAPPRLAADPPARFLIFGDAAVMIAQSEPYSGKPAHITRIWVKRENLWRMALSYQTAIQSAAEIAAAQP